MSLRAWSCAVVACIAACHQSSAVSPAPAVARSSTVDTAALARRRADSLARLAWRRDSAARVAHQDSINQGEDSLRTLVAVARRSLFATVHFDTGRAEIRKADQTILDRKAALLVKNPNLRLKVFGYANDRGSSDRARQLGMERATAVRKYLVARGVDSTHVSIASNGDARLLCRATDEACRAKNRRDEFSIITGGGEITPK